MNLFPSIPLLLPPSLSLSPSLSPSLPLSLLSLSCIPMHTPRRVIPMHTPQRAIAVHTPRRAIPEHTPRRAIPVLTAVDQAVGSDDDLAADKLVLASSPPLLPLPPTRWALVAI